jgi:N-acetylmuramoyl-L-alanine amidase
MRELRRGDAGPAVAEVRATLAGLGLLPSANGTGEPAQYDLPLEQAIRAFQQQRGLITDGIVGPATYQALRDATYRLGGRPLAYLVSAPVSGDDVLELQERLLQLGYNAGRPNGVFGAQTELALRDFQRDYGLTIDGMCGTETVRAFGRLSPRASGGRPVLLREEEQVRRAGPRLRGKRIVIDPGHGAADTGVLIDGIREADLMWDLARRLEGRMVATGMEAMLSRGPDQCPTEAERANFANEAGGDVFISLHCDKNTSSHASGVASFFFGAGTNGSSSLGEALAGFIQRELTVRTGMQNCRTHAKTWDSLRLTRCPAVRVEIGYLSNEGDRARLSDPSFRDLVAEGILVSVKRLYLLGEGDQPTGTFSFADLMRHELATS